LHPQADSPAEGLDEPSGHEHVHQIGMDLNPGQQPMRSREGIPAVLESTAHQDDAVTEWVIPGNSTLRLTLGDHRAARDGQEALRWAGEVNAP
jgi:hypothetical protein